MATELKEAVWRLEEIRDEIWELTEEAYQIVRDVGSHHDAQYAKGYWYAHLLGALSDDSGFVGGSMGPLESTIETLKARASVQFPEGRPVEEIETGRTGKVVTADEAAVHDGEPEVEVEVEFDGTGERAWRGVDELEPLD